MKNNESYLEKGCGCVDMVKFIRSIQRLEGNPDCFRKKAGYCESITCAWRLYCIDAIETNGKKEILGEENGSVE